MTRGPSLRAVQLGLLLCVVAAGFAAWTFRPSTPVAPDAGPPEPRLPEANGEERGMGSYWHLRFADGRWWIGDKSTTNAKMLVARLGNHSSGSARACPTCVIEVDRETPTAEVSDLLAAIELLLGAKWVLLATRSSDGAESYLPLRLAPVASPETRAGRKRSTLVAALEQDGESTVLSVESDLDPSGRVEVDAAELVHALDRLDRPLFLRVERAAPYGKTAVLLARLLRAGLVVRASSQNGSDLALEVSRPFPAPAKISPDFRLPVTVLSWPWTGTERGEDGLVPVSILRDGQVRVRGQPTDIERLADALEGGTSPSRDPTLVLAADVRVSWGDLRRLLAVVIASGADPTEIRLRCRSSSGGATWLRLPVAAKPGAPGERLVVRRRPDGRVACVLPRTLDPAGAEFGVEDLVPKLHALPAGKPASGILVEPKDETSLGEILRVLEHLYHADVPAEVVVPAQD